MAEECNKSERPWGFYEVLTVAKRYQVKRIVVNPGQCLSLQKHFHRAEHWIVVSGTAEVTCNETVKLIHENQSTYIPLGHTHRLHNPGKIPLEMIEVQSGAYLGEDDIVRYDDVYGRNKE
jgi:mannose-1-phosphate guanylyltransferase/mannose-6-phosphate isomerase